VRQSKKKAAVVYKQKKNLGQGLDTAFTVQGGRKTSFAAMFLA